MRHAALRRAATTSGRRWSADPQVGPKRVAYRHPAGDRERFEANARTSVLDDVESLVA
jgi:hypothetical protein